MSIVHFKGSALHNTVADCLHAYMESVAPDLSEADFDAAWTAFGILVNLAIRRPIEQPGEAPPSRPDQGPAPALDNGAPQVEEQGETIAVSGSDRREDGSRPGYPVSGSSLPSLFDPPSGGGVPPEPVAAQAVIPPAPAPPSDVTFTCDCGRNFGSAHALRIHVARAHPTGSAPPPQRELLDHVCFACDKRFASGKELAEHRRSGQHRVRVGGGAFQ